MDVDLTRRSLLGALAAASALATTAAPARSVLTSRRPNFVIFYVDDLGYGDIEPNGGTIIRTPSLSALARGGTTLTDYYAPANLCTPSRAGFLTGRYPIRTGLGRGVIMPTETRGLPLTEVTISEALKPAYATGLVGKWHLGNPGTAAWPPTRHGFDRFYGIQYSHDMINLRLWDIRGDSVAEAPVEQSRLQQQFRDAAESFIDDNHDRPFFLTVALSAPHLPNYPAEGFRNISRAGAYGDVVEEVDAIVGSIMAKLEHHGITNQTTVIFTSDNGPWFEGSAGGLRDRKGGAAYDGASRVPFIAHCPGTIVQGARNKSIAMGIDLFPTICDIARIRLPSNLQLDGLNIAPVLNRAAASPHDQLLLFNDEDVVGIRTQSWKYVDAAYYRDKLYPLASRGYPQLYDMDMPGENYSVASLHPDVLAAMKARLAAARNSFESLRTASSH